MKKLICELILITFFWSNQATAFQNEPDGFRGIKWGEDYQKHNKDLELINKEHNITFYKKINDKLTISNTELSNIKYVFFNNNFAYIEAYTLDGDLYDQLSKVLKVNFGKSEYSYDYKYYKKGNQTTIKYSCGWRYISSSSDFCKLIIGSTILLKSLEEYKNRVIKQKTENDF